MANNAEISELIPKSGLTFTAYSLNPVFCKPKLMPLKSVTLEKLEKMQKEAQQKLWQMEMGEKEESKEEATEIKPDGEPGQKADVWRAEEDEGTKSQDL